MTEKQKALENKLINKSLSMLAENRALKKKLLFQAELISELREDLSLEKFFGKIQIKFEET